MNFKESLSYKVALTCKANKAKGFSNIECVPADKSGKYRWSCGCAYYQNLHFVWTDEKGHCLFAIYEKEEYGYKLIKSIPLNKAIQYIYNLIKESNHVCS